ncbi:MAG: MFS transporter [Acidobacteria bacterium]|nr:MFS transporter [Acidobacteriota bacterium]
MTPSEQPSNGIKKLRWWICTLLFLATLINYLDRQTFAVATPAIVEEFGLSNDDVANINIAFTSAYMVGQLVTGRFMDVLGTRLGFLLIMLFWSVSGILCSTARGISSLSLFRFCLGLGEAGNWPASVKAVSEWFPARERGLGVAYFSGGGSGLGAMIAPVVIAQLILWRDWRWAFVIIGLLGFLWVPLWLWFYRTPDQHWLMRKEELEELQEEQSAEGAGSAQKKQGIFAGWGTVLRYRQVWGVTSVRFFSDSILWFYLAWLPKYFVDERGYQMEDIRDRLWMVFLPAIFASFLGGGISGRLIEEGWSVNRARKTVMLVSGLAMVSSLGVGLVESDVTALVLSGIALLSFYAYSTNTLTLPADLVPPRLVASVSGFSGMGAGLGSVLFTKLVGYVADTYSFTPVFVLVGILPLLSLASLFFLMGPVTRVVRK